MRLQVFNLYPATSGTWFYWCSIAMAHTDLLLIKCTTEAEVDVAACRIVAETVRSRIAGACTVETATPVGTRTASARSSL